MGNYRVVYLLIRKTFDSKKEKTIIKVKEKNNIILLFTKSRILKII